MFSRKVGKRKGFTLIELLVVISIIALLIAILMPALNKAKEQATGAVCLSNQKGLILAYTMYADDNNSKLPNAVVFANQKDIWVYPPTLADGTIVEGGGQDVLKEDRLRGLRRGVLYPYTKTTEIYHCPGDKRWNKGTRFGDSPAYRMYRSYNIQGGLHGEEEWRSAGGSVKRISDVKNAALTYVFVEEFYDGAYANNNGGSWQLDGMNNGHSWWNIMAIWHNKKSTLSFIDGHAEMMNWVDERTIDYAVKRDNRDQPDNPDLEFMIRGYAVPLPRP